MLKQVLALSGCPAAVLSRALHHDHPVVPSNASLRVYLPDADTRHHGSAALLPCCVLALISISIPGKHPMAALNIAALPSAAADARVLSSYHTIIVLFNSDESLHAAPHEFHLPTTISAYRTSTVLVLVLVGWLPLLLGRLQQAANRLAIADGTADGPSRGRRGPWLDRYSERPLKTICPPVEPLQFRSCRGGREHHIMRGNPCWPCGRFSHTTLAV